MINTIYSPSFLQPSNTCQDYSLPQILSAQVNGIQIDSFQIQIKDVSNNNILFDSGSTVNILNSDSNITYSGTWTTATNQIVDDNNSLVQYYGNGWTMTTDSHYYNSTTHHSNITNDYAQYSFVGTGINIYTTFGIDKGIFQVFIDGFSEGTIDTYAVGTDINGNNFQTLAYTITNLAYGNHTVKVLVLGTKNSSSTNSRIELDYFQVLNIVGSKNSNVADTYFQYSFTSNGINVYMDTTPDSGTIQIYIDNISQGIIDLYSPAYTMNSLVYTNTNLAYGIHIIKVVATGNKNTQSSNSFCYFESLSTTNKTALSTTLYDKQLFNFTLPANTVTQRGALKWQLTYWNSSNAGENVSSGEMLFTNMSAPIAVLNAPNSITNKSFTFTSTYSQAESIPIKKYNYSLYGVNYIVDEFYFGMQVTGTVVDEGSFGTIVSGYHIDEGTF